LDYQSTLQYLYSFTDYEKERIARYDPDTLDLSRVRRVCARLGNPHQRFPSVHIAGTKGKGSVAATCAAVLQTAGLQTGLYTSPHLHTFRERIQVNGEPIPAGKLTDLVQECRPIFDTEPEFTTFEAITALAFTYFAQRRVDFAVVEVGLGGRLDATNVITPWVSVITSLSYDHTYLLGNTLAEIAREKAGIIKPDIPTVSAPQSSEALTVIEQVCAARGSPLTLVGRDWNWEVLPPPLPPSPASASTSSATDDFPLGLDGQSFDLRHTQGTSHLDGTYTTPFLGRHQLENTVAAIAALDLLERRGVPLRARDVRQGIASVRWPGRFEVLQRDPLLVVDCAHNGDSAVKLAAALEEWFPGRNWTFVLGASIDKDLPAILRALAPLARQVLATQSHHPRAMPSERVAQLASEILAEAGAPFADIKPTDDVASALNLALPRDDAEHDSPHPFNPQERHAVRRPRAGICVTGSIFVVAEAREVWALDSGGALPETDRPLDVGLLPLSQAVAGHTIATTS
jgi:dihydrofolate synthase/folylpolyglutamate synthase